jgi:hypothetical protein
MSWLQNGLLLLLVVFMVGAAFVVALVMLGQQYWKKRNIYTLKTRVPLIGHMGKMILRKQSFPELVQVQNLIATIFNTNGCSHKQRIFTSSSNRLEKTLAGFISSKGPPLSLAILISSGK